MCIARCSGSTPSPSAPNTARTWLPCSKTCNATGPPPPSGGACWSTQRHRSSSNEWSSSWLKPALVPSLRRSVALFVLVIALAVRGTPGTAFGLLFVALAACGLMGVLYCGHRPPMSNPPCSCTATGGGISWPPPRVLPVPCRLGCAQARRVDVVVHRHHRRIVPRGRGVVLGVWHGVYRLRSVRRI